MNTTETATDPEPRHALMTAQEVADLFRVSSMTVHRWGRDGTLHPVTIGSTVRFNRIEVEALLTTDGSAA